VDIFPVFAVALGVEKVSEGLAPARKMFVENKKLLKPLPNEDNFATTLVGYNRNNFSNEHKNTASLKTVKSLIYKHGLKFFEDCGYDIVRHDIEVSNIWLNEMKSETEHPRHLHYGFQISGCFYVDVPENSGNIMFSNLDHLLPFGASSSIKNYTIFNSLSWSLNPEEGDMYFWRSDLPHQVLSKSFIGVRRSIAFDISVIART
jgi:uncharacterized protein (TIGR02466 family)